TIKKVLASVSRPKIKPRSHAGYRLGSQVRIMKQRERPSWKDGEEKTAFRRQIAGVRAADGSVSSGGKPYKTI
ncbi:MAG: hypothetical protein D3925_08205, partial [Candidatus Electrothrix sp. AR5]|nr:hypothetical protein [Candidatus Electrothrix sp. AR5]